MMFLPCQEAVFCERHNVKRQGAERKEEKAASQEEEEDHADERRSNRGGNADQTEEGTQIMQMNADHMAA